MIEKQKHIHKLKRLKYKSGNITFFCALPDCNFKINPALALGKRSLCWRCGNDFIINEYALRLAKPHCESCHKPKKVVDSDGINITGIGIGESLIRDTLELESLSLSQRLNQTIQQAQKQEEEL